MASRRFTISEQRFPQTPEFTSLVRRWNERGIEILFSLVWTGYDLLWTEVLRDTSWTGVADDLERDLTEHLETRIRQSMTGYEPFDIQHGRHERESRLPAPAQPPQYDLAFYLRESPRSNFPLEAKVLRSEKQLSDYVEALKSQFLTCRYAPFSAEAAMLGYLIGGAPSSFFSGLQRDVPCELYQHQGFPQRPHRFSDHHRDVPPGKPYPVRFRCHHLILQLTAPSGGKSS